jgi:hypothetical protein
MDLQRSGKQMRPRPSTGLKKRAPLSDMFSRYFLTTQEPRAR